jgi:enoyl-CoA hydratase/carnithine racemase
MTTDLVLLEMADRHVAVVTLNRPEKRNAVSVEVTRPCRRWSPGSSSTPRCAAWC